MEVEVGEEGEEAVVDKSAGDCWLSTGSCAVSILPANAIASSVFALTGPLLELTKVSRL